MKLTENTLPMLGSRRAAVMALTNMMAAALGEDEGKLSYWLDAYYQLRRLYEDEQGYEPEADTAEPEMTNTAPEPDAPSRELATIADKAELKRSVREKLLELRAAGWSGPKLQKLVLGEISLSTVYAMINAESVNLDKWQSMAIALDKLNKQEGKAHGK